ncbi:MAG: response regulator [Sphingomonas adhaesiva]|uniref:response regulator n=1 Tax=Sphingomonas adhaesiva TaxID=28212 RepID=UPI002FF6DAC5
MATALTRSGWAVTTCGQGRDVLPPAAPCPALILLDLRVAGPDALDTIAAIRRSPLPAGSIPVVALTTTRPTGLSVLTAHGFDGVLPRPATPDDLARLSADWHPGEENRSLDRLADSFGAAQIASMAARLRDLFATAVVAIDRGEVRDLAHRIAGVAGTLGFARVGQAWRALSDADGGDAAVQAAARREARRAIALIDRRLAPENGALPST